MWDEEPKSLSSRQYSLCHFPCVWKSLWGKVHAFLLPPEELAAYWGDLPLLLFLGTSGHRRVWIAGRDGEQATVTEGQTRSLQRERAKGEGLKAREKRPCLQKLLWDK